MIFHVVALQQGFYEHPALLAEGFIIQVNKNRLRVF